MKVVVIGCGHVGLPTAVSLANLGHQVVAVDDDAAKIKMLQRNEVPFFEPGLQELLAEVDVTFAESPKEGIPGAEVAFICVGTPAKASGEANLLAVERAARSIAEHATGELVIVQKSTVPVHTADWVHKVVTENSKHDFKVVSNPEFLREGKAIEDSLKPWRVLVGADDQGAHDVMRRLYQPLITAGITYLATDVKTAELAKHACNAFLALKVSYANALARISEAAGADVLTVAEIMGTDPRIGREFLDAGLGFGGYCLPKDVAAFKVQASKLGYDFALLDEILKINAEAVEATYKKVEEGLWNLQGKRVALFGLAFKSGTDDVRESPALALARRLIEAGCTLTGHDPRANANAQAELPEMEVFDDPYQATLGAHCLVICTDWTEFTEIDLPRLKGVMTNPLIVDGRNLLDGQDVADQGFTYLPTGRPH